MANQNQLLSSVMCPLDDLPSVLMPSVPLIENKTDKSLGTRMENEQVLSLQPHLVSSSAPDLSINPGEVIETKESPAAILPPMGIPKTQKIGDSFLRKPTNKYVVPPEIETQKKAETQYIPTLPKSSPQGPIIFPSVQNPNEVITPPGSKLDVTSNFLATPASFEALAVSPPLQMGTYHPVIPHWFFSETIQNVTTWHPFSFTDSLNIEQAFRKGSPNIVATDGSRFDVNVKERQKTAIYWDSGTTPVRRCSWFRKNLGPLPVPYSEEDSMKLEKEFEDAMTTGKWHRQIELSEGERVLMNSTTSILHYQFQESSEFPNTVSISGTQQTPKVVRRGADDFTIPECAADKVDHLVFIIHGMGSFCDISFRSVEDCVGDFRKLGEELLSSHFKEAIETGQVGRVEVLPISWHKALHGDATGIDEKLKLITLRSIPKFREYINDTILDALFFTSSVYGQHIIETVASEMERLLDIYKSRNAAFSGKISVGGHSLGTVILFDLLHHQKVPTEEDKNDPNVDKENDWVKVESKMEASSESMSKVDFEIGAAGTGQPAINYPQLSFKPQAFFLMGSPVAMFITVRGLDILGPDFKLPTCGKVFNIFHPYDPVAYRIETMIDSSLKELRPVLIPHHKGRKRMHLELKDTIERVGSDIKNRIVDSVQATWNRMYQLYSGDFSATAKAMEEELLINSEISENTEHVEFVEPSVKVGKLNGGRRIDYVLQEKPYESFTGYIFALQAHLTYWNSEDTMLMILKELYKLENICSDAELNKEQRETNLLNNMPPSITEITGLASESKIQNAMVNSPLRPTGPIYSPIAPTSSMPFGVPAPPKIPTMDTEKFTALPSMPSMAPGKFTQAPAIPTMKPGKFIVSPSIPTMDPSKFTGPSTIQSTAPEKFTPTTIPTMEPGKFIGSPSIPTMDPGKFTAPATIQTMAPGLFTAPPIPPDLSATIPEMNALSNISRDKTPPLVPGVSSGMARAISGRPVFDPSMKPVAMGVDPTASPASSKIGPPPKLPVMFFKKK